MKTHYFYSTTKALLAVVLIGINLSLIAQDSLQIVMGTVRNSSNYEPISFAIVKNEMLKTKIISNEEGGYIIPVNRGDLLKITAIGFEDGFYIVNDSASLISNFPIQLKPRIYELKEFTITPYKTVMQFKHAVAQLVLPEDTPAIIHIITPKIQTPPSALGEVLGAFASPISFLYNNFSHRGKMAKKYRMLLANDYDSKVVHKRFNRNLIASIVPIETDEELDVFIEFCQFDFSFLLNASDYELIAAVQKKYMAYLLTKIPQQSK